MPDGTPAPLAGDPIADYVASARPGRRAPHVWLTHGGRQISTIDLFDGRFVLLSHSEAWCRAAREVAVEPAMPLRAAVLDDPRWAEIYEVGSAGAVLVRPDGDVGSRCPGPVTDPAGELRHALDAVLDLGGREASGPRSVGIPVT